MMSTIEEIKMLSKFIGMNTNNFELLSNDFQHDWNKLMMVVDKIISIDITPAPNWTGYRVEIVPRGYIQISGFPMPKITTNVSIEGSLINAVYKAVVQFVKWYNSQPK